MADENLGLVVTVEVKPDPDSLRNLKREVAKAMEDVPGPKFVKPKYRETPPPQTPSREIEPIVKASKEVEKSAGILKKAADTFSQALKNIRGDKKGMASVVPGINPKGNSHRGLEAAGKTKKTAWRTAVDEAKARREGVGTHTIADNQEKSLEKLANQRQEAEEAANKSQGKSERQKARRARDKAAYEEAMARGLPFDEMSEDAQRHANKLIRQNDRKKEKRKQKKEKTEAQAAAEAKVEAQLEKAQEIVANAGNPVGKVGIGAGNELRALGEKLNAEDLTDFNEKRRKGDEVAAKREKQIEKNKHMDESLPTSKPGKQKVPKDMQGIERDMSQTHPGSHASLTQEEMLAKGYYAVKGGFKRGELTAQSTLKYDPEAVGSAEWRYREQQKRAEKKAALEAILKRRAGSMDMVMADLQRFTGWHNNYQKEVVNNKQAGLPPPVSNVPYLPFMEAYAKLARRKKATQNNAALLWKEMGMPMGEAPVDDPIGDYIKNKRKASQRSKMVAEYNEDMMAKQGIYTPRTYKEKFGVPWVNPATAGQGGQMGLGDFTKNLLSKLPGGKTLGGFLDKSGIGKFLNMGFEMGGMQSPMGGGGGGGKGGKGGMGGGMGQGAKAGVVAALILIGVEVLKKLLQVLIQFMKFALNASPAWKATMGAILKLLEIVLLPIGTILSVFLRPFLMRWMPKIADMLSSSWEGIMSGDISAMQPAIEMFGQMLSELIVLLSPIFTQTAIEVITHIPWASIFAAIGIAMLATIMVGVTSLTTFITDLVAEIFHYIFEAPVALTTFIATMLSDILVKLKESVFNFTQFVSDVMNMVLNKVYNASWSAMDTLAGWLKDIIELKIANSLSVLPGGNSTSGSGSGGGITAGPFKMAEGGIATGPVNALIGEAGDEAVIPLKNGLKDYIEPSGPTEVTIEIHIHGNVYGVEDLNDAIEQGIDGYVSKVRGW